jgi:hypothetical protein
LGVLLVVVLFEAAGDAEVHVFVEIGEAEVQGGKEEDLLLYSPRRTPRLFHVVRSDQYCDFGGDLLCVGVPLEA